MEGCSESLTIDGEERVRVINSTVSIESRIIKFFEMIEADLYGRLQVRGRGVAGQGGGQDGRGRGGGGLGVCQLRLRPAVSLPSCPVAGWQGVLCVIDGARPRQSPAPQHTTCGGLPAVHHPDVCQRATQHPARTPTRLAGFVALPPRVCSRLGRSPTCITRTAPIPFLLQTCSAQFAVYHPKRNLVA